MSTIETTEVPPAASVPDAVVPSEIPPPAMTFEDAVRRHIEAKDKT